MINVRRLQKFHHVFTSDIVEQNKPTDEDYYYVDNVPVRAELYDFIQRIKKNYAFRDVRVGRKNRCFSPVNEVYLYYPDQLYVLGEIGYGDYNISENSRIKYSFKVSARGIVNNKYRPTSHYAFWMLSVNPERAVANVKKHLRPYTVPEIAALNALKLAEQADAVRHDYSWNRTKAFMADIDNRETSKIWQELLNLYQSGHKFVTDGVRDLVEDVISKSNTLAEVGTTTVNMSLVYAVPSADGTPKVTVVRGGSMQLNARVGHNILKQFTELPDSSVVHCTMDTLPEDVAGKVAVLSMLDNDTFQEGVGYRVTEGVMYVFT